MVRLARPFARGSRAVVVFGLSLVGGALNGATAGFLSGLITSPNNDVVDLSVWGGAFGLAFGLLFGLANALLVQIAVRGSRSPSTMSAGRTAVRLAATVSALVAVALAAAAADPEGIFFGGRMHAEAVIMSHGSDIDVVAPSRRSLALAFVVPVAITLLAATLAVTSARAQSLRRRWLARVTRGEDSRYRVLPCDAAAAATPLALFDGPGEGERADIIVRVDVVDEVDGGAYRHAEHLTAVARLSR